MDRRGRAVSLLIAVCAWGLSAQATCPDTACSSSAARYLVRDDCTGLSDCFEDVAAMLGTSDLNVPPAVAAPNSGGWLWDTRAPSGSAPVEIDVGPGTFDPFVCPDGSGHVIVRGAGRDQTTFGGGATGFDAWNCQDVVLSDLRVEGTAYGVRWLGNGEGLWNRVDMVSTGAGEHTNAHGWGDFCLTSGTSTHNIYDSRVIVTGVPTIRNASYVTWCAETYMYRSQILITTLASTVTSGSSLAYTGLEIKDGSEFHLIDSQVVAHTEQTTVGSTGVDVIGILTVGSGNFLHMQDSAIRVRAEAAPSATVDAVGIRAASGTILRRLATSIDVEATGGSEVEIE